jgi:hypothetical protein
VDILKQINEKASELNRKAQKLTEIEIVWGSPIVIDCNELTNLENIKSDKRFIFFNSINKVPAIYYFIIKSKIEPNIVVHHLNIYKKSKQRSCPKIDKKRNLESRYLYCGSIKKGIHGRLIQHLGFGSKNTYGLQLVHWAKKLNLELEFNYCFLDPKYVEFTELIESSLALKINPLVGKIA